jgi:FlaG/FlaF family flagellin (archaellin)
MAKPSNFSPFFKFCFFTLTLITISACSSDNDDDGDNTGHIKFFNASPNSPGIFLTIDEALDSEDDEEYESTFSAIGYGSAGSRIELESDEYYIELAWQDEDSSERSDLEMLYQSQINVQDDNTYWVVMSGSVEAPTVDIFTIADRDEDEIDEDADNDVFNLRLLNLHPDYSSVDVYFSDTDETFNEATLLDTAVLSSLSENTKLAQDQYLIYLTAAGSNEVLFSSDDVSLSFNAQYVISLRENQGSGGSPFVIDVITNTSISEYSSAESLAKITVFNGLNRNDNDTSYVGEVDVVIEGVTDIPLIDDLAYSEFSEAFQVDSGDYRFSVTNNDTQLPMLENRLLSLSQNTNQSLFLYWTEEAVDEDGDGDIDENDDGIIDEIRPIVNSVLVNNSELQRLYDKQITLLNLVQSDDFTTVAIYFVKSNEIISTTNNVRRLAQGVSSSITLLNNTYTVFAVAEIDGNEIILDELTMTLDEDSEDQFLLLEQDDASGSGYILSLFSQNN